MKDPAVLLLCAALATIPADRLLAGDEGSTAAKAPAGDTVQGAPSAPWEALFSAAPSAVAEAAAAAVRDIDNKGIVVLYEERVLRLAADGRAEQEYRQVYVTTTPAGAKSWSTLSSHWFPWYQERPEFRARVVTAGGGEHSLDPATVGEVSGDHDRNDQVYSDVRQLQAPLPGVDVGAVVEREIVIRDTAPFFSAGTVHWQGFGRVQVPVVKQRFVVEAPAGLPVRFHPEQLADVEPRREEVGGRVRWTFEAGPFAGRERIPPLLPSEVSRWPGVGVSTGRSWADVATAYGAVVDGQIAGADLGAVVAEATGGAGSRREKIDALLAWLHRQVRYTGIEFLDASIVPRSPAETLARKYGDCKDKAALLVALLRAAEIPAEVALLDAGTDQDPVADLPGLGAFDHAIVHVAGDPELWIDATAEFARAGELPVGDQSRLALIAAPGTTGLVRTPAAGPEANREVTIREFLLADFGPGTVIEKYTVTGAEEQILRQRLAGHADDEVRKGFATQVEKSYGGGELEELECTDPHDLSAPYHIHYRLRGAASVATDLAQVTVPVGPQILFANLPDALKRPAEDDPRQEEPPAPRTDDWVLPWPYSEEVRFRFVPPVGFAAVEVPPAKSWQWGPAKLERETLAGDGDELTVVYRFATGPGRFSPAEAELLQEGVAELSRQDDLRLDFLHRGESLLAGGHIAEALAELRPQAAAEPDRALPRARIARALIAAGLGEAARNEAEEAVRLEPDSAIVQQALGLVLVHDLLGRYLQPGADLAGAEQAFRRAVELEPKSAVDARNLAVVLEYGRDLERYGEGAQLDEAIAQYRRVRDELKEHSLDDALLITLFHAERFDEARRLLTEIEPTPTRRAIGLATTAATAGGAAALEAAAKISDGGERRQALELASAYTLQLRLYGPAADLQAAAALGSAEATQALALASTLRRMKRFEDRVADAADPRDLYHRLNRETLLAGPDGERPLWRRLAADTGEDLEELIDTLDSYAWTFSDEAAAQGLPREAAFDFSQAGVDTAVDGDAETGYRVRALRDGQVEETIFAAPEGDGLRLVAVESHSLAPIGVEAERLRKAGRLEAARTWLDWVREDSVAGSADDPYGGTPFTRFWSKGSAAEPETVRLAAAALTAGGGQADLALPVLTEGLAAADGADRRRDFEAALVAAYLLLERWDDLAVLARRHFAEAPTSDSAFFGLALALIPLERWDELRLASETRLERLPGDAPAREMLATAAEGARDYRRAQEVRRELVRAGKAQAADFNQLAWLAIVLEEVGDQALDDAQRAVAASGQAEAASLHTLAAVYAELGRTTEARDVLLQSIAADGASEPKSHDWYVLGRIAEQLGVPEAAADAYRRVEPERGERAWAEPMSTHMLAQRRLATMAAAAIPGSDG